MQEQAKQTLNEDLENFEKKLSMIALSDPEKYKEFSERLDAVQNNLIGISEIELERTKADVVASVVRLQSDFDAYMNGNNVPTIITDLSKVGKVESGKAKLKNYKINLYSSIIDDLGKLDVINITDIDVIKDKWIEDVQDEYLSFSPFEKSAMEEKLSRVFLEYQIKYLQKNGRLPAERIEDYANKDEYIKGIKDKLIDASKLETTSGTRKLQIDSLLKEDDLNSLVKDKLLWDILSGKTVSYDERRLNSILGIEEKREEKEPVKVEDEPKKEELALVISKQRISPKYMTCIIKKTNKFFNKGKVSYKPVNVRVRNGIAKVPPKLRDKIIEAYIPDGVVSIADEGFWNCQELRKVVLPRTLKEIGYESFRNCYQLEEMNLPEGLETIGVRGLYYCSALKDPKLPSTIRKIGAQACETVPFKSLVFTDKLEELGERAFTLCDELEEVKFEGKYETIPKQCFANCRKLKSMIFPEGLKKICEDAFANCRQLKDFTNLPDTVETIERYAIVCAERIRVPSRLRRMERQALNAKREKLELIMPPKCNQIEGVTSMQEDADIKVIFPDEFEGDIYEKLGITPGETMTLRDLRKKKAIKDNNDRNEFLDQYYGPDAHKYKHEYVDGTDDFIQ